MLIINLYISYPMYSFHNKDTELYVICQFILTERQTYNLLNNHNNEYNFISIQFFDCRETNFRYTNDKCAEIEKNIKNALKKVIVDINLDLTVIICSTTVNYSEILNYVLYGLIKEGIDLQLLYVAIGNEIDFCLYDLSNNIIYTTTEEPQYLPNNFEFNKTKLLDIVSELINY